MTRRRARLLASWIGLIASLYVIYAGISLHRSWAPASDTMDAAAIATAAGKARGRGLLLLGLIEYWPLVLVAIAGIGLAKCLRNLQEKSGTAALDSQTVELERVIGRRLAERTAGTWSGRPNRKREQCDLVLSHDRFSYRRIDTVHDLTTECAGAWEIKDRKLRDGTVGVELSLNADSQWAGLPLMMLDGERIRILGEDEVTVGFLTRAP